MNFLELSQALRQETGGSGSGPPSVIGQIGESKLYVDWINDAWVYIQNRRSSWRFMWKQSSIDLEIDTQLYDLPDDFKTFDDGSIYLYRDGHPHCMKLLDYACFRDQFIVPSVGMPSYCCIMPNGKFKTNTLTDSGDTIVFDYFKKASLLESNTDIPSLPEEYHSILVYLGMKSYGGYENAMEVYQRGDVKYEEMLIRLEMTQLPELEIAGPLA